jgi:hypothetical protein
MRLKLEKLAAAQPVPPPTAFVPRNDLLHEPEWPQDVTFLRDLYDDIIHISDEAGNDPAMDEWLYKTTEPKLKELITGLNKVIDKVTWLPVIVRDAHFAKYDFEKSVQAYNAGDFAKATLYQTYSLSKFRSVIIRLTDVGNTPPRKRNASYIEKIAYGYDISGEVFEGSGEMANRENQENINDSGTPDKHHETAPNPANLMRDVDADKEFPELAEEKNHRVIWPPRLR